ncbi:hypothetical protein L8T89_01905 [Campylobacter lari]|nr:hypothetical protein [Campylobacter lari]
MVFKKDDVEILDLNSFKSKNGTVVIKQLDEISLVVVELHEINTKLDEISLFSFENNKIDYSNKNVQYLGSKIIFKLFSFENKIKEIIFKVSKNIDIVIYKLRYPGLLISARSDGFGARLHAMLNALYYSEITGCKFGYVWEKSYHDQDSLNKDGFQKGMYLGYEIDLFDHKFIKDYSYTGKIPSTLKINKKYDLNEIRYKFDYYWGNYIDYDFPYNISDKKIFKNYPRMWKKIQFSSRFKKIINEAYEVSSSIFGNDKFTAVHIRSGNIVFDDKVKNYGLGFHKSMPVEIALELINKCFLDKFKVVLFGDDIDELKVLKEYFLNLNLNIYIIDDFSEKYFGIEKVIFELVFMSNANCIYSARSSYARVASYIGLGKEPLYYTRCFCENEQLDILLKNLSYLHTIHPLQRAHSFFYIGVLFYRLHRNISHASIYIEKALKLDINNTYYQLLILFFLLKKKKYQEAQEYILKYNIDVCKFKLNLKKGILIEEVFEELVIFKLGNRGKFKSLSKFINLLLEDFTDKIFTLKQQVIFSFKRSLEYQIGELIINNSEQNIFKIIQMIYLFNINYQADYILFEHNQKINKNDEIIYNLGKKYTKISFSNCFKIFYTLVSDILSLRTNEKKI